MQTETRRLTVPDYKSGGIAFLASVIYRWGAMRGTDWASTHPMGGIFRKFPNPAASLHLVSSPSISYESISLRRGINNNTLCYLPDRLGQPPRGFLLPARDTLAAEGKEAWGHYRVKV